MKNLNRVLRLKRECYRAAEKLDELETLSERLTANLSDMPRSDSPTPMDEWWARYIDQRTYAAEKLQAYINEIDNLEKELNQLHDENVRLAMQYRYINGRKVSEIAEAMYYSERYVYKLLKKGRKEYNSLFREEQTDGTPSLK